jgi:hypothetical protein
MSNPFFERPIVNSPYEYPRQHWELDPSGQPTGRLIDRRRRAEFITPIPKPKKRHGADQQELGLDDGRGLSTNDQAYDLTSVINEVRGQVDIWRTLPASQWQVTPETGACSSAGGSTSSAACGRSSVRSRRWTAIWFTEVAPHLVTGKRLLDNLKRVNEQANPLLQRLALKLATGAGKTTVMAMLIAWSTLNAVRRPGSKHFSERHRADRAVPGQPRGSSAHCICSTDQLQRSAPEPRLQTNPRPSQPGCARPQPMAISHTRSAFSSGRATRCPGPLPLSAHLDSPHASSTIVCR